MSALQTPQSYFELFDVGDMSTFEQLIDEVATFVSDNVRKLVDKSISRSWFTGFSPTLSCQSELFILLKKLAITSEYIEKCCNQMQTDVVNTQR